MVSLDILRLAAVAVATVLQEHGVHPNSVPKVRWEFDFDAGGGTKGCYFKNRSFRGSAVVLMMYPGISNSDLFMVAVHELAHHLSCSRPLLRAMLRRYVSEVTEEDERALVERYPQEQWEEERRVRGFSNYCSRRFSSDIAHCASFGLSREHELVAACLV